MTSASPDPNESALGPAESALNIQSGQVTVGGNVVGRDQTNITTNIAAVYVGAQPPPTSAADESPAPGESPFKGLQYFDEADAHLFFGREQLTAKLAGRLRAQRFLAVVGASGSGKSSVVRAGLIPALRRGEPLADGVLPPDGSPRWPIHVITPTSHPLEALAASLTRDSESVTATATLIDDLARDPRSLHLAVRKILSRSPSPGVHPERSETKSKDASGEGAGGWGLLLLVDQFEELFTLCRDEDERKMFVENLLHATAPETDRPTIIVITLRADFYAHCAQYAGLRAALAQHQEYIGPMSAEELRRAIEEPARRGEWEFESGLVDVLLQEVKDEPGALPLLSHALLETWKRRRGRKLTLAGYAESGGVRGAIAQTAERVFNQLTPEQQAIARAIFLRLTELGEGTQDTRRRAALDELIPTPDDKPAVNAALKILADARLVTTSEGAAEVAHEALIREWPLLRKWLDENREGLKIHRHLTEAAGEWARRDRDPGELYRGARLSAAREWAVNAVDLNALEREFLLASTELVEREKAERETQQQRELEAEAARKLAEEQTRAADRLRARNRIIMAISALTLIAAIAAGFFGHQADQNAAKALAANTQSAQNLSTAEAASTLAVSEAQNRATQQAIAEANLVLAESLRLVSEANAILSDPAGNAETAALLAIRGLQITYSTQADAALVKASSRPFATRSFTGHTDFVTSVAFSPDGKYALTGSVDDTARLWNVDTGAAVRTFTGPAACVAFSPDGKYVLTGGVDSTAHLWNAATDAEVRAFTGHTGFVTSLAFSPDGKYVLTGSVDKTARLWNADTGAEVRAFTGHTDLVNSAAFSPDGKYVLTGSDDKTARLWNAQTGVEARAFMGHTSRVSSVAFSSDGQLVLTGSDDTTARLWNTATGVEVRVFTGHTDSVWSVAFSPDGKSVLTGGASGDKTARLWNAATGAVMHVFTGHTDSVNSVAFSPDGKSVLTGSDDTTASLWKVEAREARTFTDHTNPVVSVAFSPDGKSVLTEGGDKTARLWNVATGAEVRVFAGHTDSVYSVAFSPDGKYILTGSGDKTARLWNAATGAEVRAFTGHIGPVVSVAFSPDGQSVLTGGASGDKTARLWNAATGAEVRAFTGHTGSVWSVAFSPDGQSVLTGSGDKTARLWDAATGAEVRAFTGHTDFVDSVVFSPDGKYVLTGSGDDTARLWNAATGAEVRIFIGHTNFVNSAVFSPDGKYVLTGSNDTTARLWNAATGAEVRVFAGHTDSVYSVAFSPDGKYVFTGSPDKTARLWDTDYHDFIDWMCSRLPRDFTDSERQQYRLGEGATCEE